MDKLLQKMIDDRIKTYGPMMGGVSADEQPSQSVQVTASPDPWAHRSVGMRCRTCMWFVTKVVAEPRTTGDERGALGRCRRHAPTLGGFPAVFENDWCGDHKLDETKM